MYREPRFTRLRGAETERKKDSGVEGAIITETAKWPPEGRGNIKTEKTLGALKK